METAKIIRFPKQEIKRKETKEFSCVWPTPRHVATNTPPFTKLPPRSPLFPLRRKTRVLSFSEKRVTACFLSRPQRGEMGGASFCWAHLLVGAPTLGFGFCRVLNQSVLLPRVGVSFTGAHSSVIHILLTRECVHTNTMMIALFGGPLLCHV